MKCSFTYLVHMFWYRTGWMGGGLGAGAFSLARLGLGPSLNIQVKAGKIFNTAIMNTKRYSCEIMNNFCRFCSDHASYEYFISSTFYKSFLCLYGGRVLLLAVYVNTCLT